MLSTRFPKTWQLAVGWLTAGFTLTPAIAQANFSPVVALAPAPLTVPVDLPVADAPLGRAADHLPQPSRQSVTHLVLKLSERTLYLYNHQQELERFSVAVGRTGWETPTGQFAVLQKVPNPAWEHPFTGEVVPPGDGNPLGQRWIGFWSDGINSIGFHGTPQEELIGQAVSHGCVRLRNEDVVALYDLVEVGTAVYVVP